MIEKLFPGDGNQGEAKMMGRWARKMKRSGFSATVRRQGIKEALRKFQQMCQTEDQGGRPIHRARVWQKAARRLAKERKQTYWHKTRADGVSSPPHH